MKEMSSLPPKKEFFIIGSLSKNNITNSITTHEQLKVHIECLQSNIPFITLETTLFPFLFPQGEEGAYDGRISLNDYFKYCTSMLFFPFILYEPYLLCM
jgi:hypothetical protein